VAPVVVLLALLVLAGVSLDVGTIMVANVTLGIAVDDTYHFMWMYGRARKSGLGRYSAIYKARGQVQSPMVGATAVNSVGFLVLIFSTFPPMRIFGILVAAGLWLALAAEWFLMPPLMVVCRPRIKVSE
jgi:predicted RND superfamily exporter protein